MSLRTAPSLGKGTQRSFIMTVQTSILRSNRRKAKRNTVRVRNTAQNPIVQMGLFIDGDGIPLAFSTFPGNQNEQVSLKPLESKNSPAVWM